LSGSSVTEVLAQPIGQEVQEDSLGTSWPLKMKPIGCPETSVQNYHLRSVISQNSADLDFNDYCGEWTEIINIVYIGLLLHSSVKVACGMSSLWPDILIFSLHFFVCPSNFREY
jgi:hypothetical protein